MKFEKTVGQWSYIIDVDNVSIIFKPEKGKQKKITVKNDMEVISDLKHILRGALKCCMLTDREKRRLKELPNCKQLNLLGD